MRIAVVVHGFPVVSETFITNQITGLIDAGHEVDIYAASQGNCRTVDPRVHEYKLLERTHYRPWAPHSFRSYEIIHCHFGPIGSKLVQSRAQGFPDAKVVTSFHGYDVSSYPREYGSDIYNELFHMGDYFTANTAYTAARVIALGCPIDKITKLPEGLELSKYPFRPRTIFPGEKIRILTVARLVEKKGLEYALRAVSEIRKSYPTIEYQVAGDGYLRRLLEMQIADHNLSNCIRLLGDCTPDEVRMLLDQAHIFVLPSITAANGDQEGQALVLQEAQATGLPVVSTLHNGIPEGVLDGVSGILVPEKDSHALAEKIMHLVRHSNVWPQMGRAGRSFVEKHYDIAKLNRQLCEIYDHVLTR